MLKRLFKFSRCQKRTTIKRIVGLTVILIAGNFLCSLLIGSKWSSLNFGKNNKKPDDTSARRSFVACLDGSLKHDRFLQFKHQKNGDEFNENCGEFLSSALFNNRTLVDSSQKLLVNELEQWLKKRYFADVRESMHKPNYCPVKFVQYACDPRNLCGGFGDRTRGMVSLFYLALLSNRVFHVRWLQPVDLGAYFSLNSELYGIKPKYEIPPPAKNHRKFIDGKDQNAFSNFISSANFTSEIAGENVLSIGTNLWKIVENGPFENDHFLPTACYYFNDFPRIEEVTQTALFSAALRILLGKPNHRLRFEFDTFLAKLVFPSVSNYTQRQIVWQSTFKIGIQMRFERSDWLENPKNRVSLDQTQCFIDEAVRIAKQQENRQKDVLVFVTSSDNNASNKVVQTLVKTWGIHAVALTMAPVVHVDRYFWLPTIENNANMTRGDLIRGNTKVVLDWYMLTQMDRLVVSQSSFATSASLFSMVPTRIFDHVSGSKKKCKFYDRT